MSLHLAMLSAVALAFITAAWARDDRKAQATLQDESSLADSKVQQ